MTLPILISVSLAPGSYFFCAFAALAVIAAHTATATKLLVRAGIVFSRLHLILIKCRKSRAGLQAPAYSARPETALLRIANYD
jgi:hypothetical protein